MRQPNRIQPRLPAASMKTYALAAPLASHWRPATCAEAECPFYLHGWRSPIDETTELGQAQAYYIRHQSGRAFTEHRDGAGLTVFTFEAGQECFPRPGLPAGMPKHQVPLEREPLYLVRGGDWRGNPRGEPARRHVRPEDWVDDFAEHQQDLADRLERG